MSITYLNAETVRSKLENIRLDFDKSGAKSKEFTYNVETGVYTIKVDGGAINDGSEDMLRQLLNHYNHIEV